MARGSMRDVSLNHHLQTSEYSAGCGRSILLKETLEEKHALSMIPPKSLAK